MFRGFFAILLFVGAAATAKAALSPLPQILPRTIIPKIKIAFYDELPPHSGVAAAISQVCAQRGGCAGELALKTRLPKLPDVEWLHIYEMSSAISAKNLASRICHDRGWKIFVVNEAPPDSLMSSIKKCGVQILLTPDQHYQEHLSTDDEEIFTQGAAVRVSDVDQKHYKPGDSFRQNFARAEHGFALLEAAPEKLEVRFFNSRGKEIYMWNSARGIGLNHISKPR